MKKIIFLYSFTILLGLFLPKQESQTQVAIFPIILGVAALAAGVAKGIAAKSAHNKYAKKLDKLQKTMPQGIMDAEKIVNNMSSNGLIGYNQMREEAKNTLSGSINSYKDLVDNPSALLQATQTAEQNVNSQLTQLSIQDAVTKAQNLSAVADFQTGVKAPMQERIEDFNNSKTMAAAKERMMGTKELWGGIEQGVSNGINAYAGMKQLQSVPTQSTPVDDMGPQNFNYASGNGISNLANFRLGGNLDWQHLVNNSRGFANIDRFRLR